MATHTLHHIIYLLQLQDPLLSGFPLTYKEDTNE